MDLFEEIKKSFSQMEKLIETRHMENFIARGYESAPYFYYSSGDLVDLRILNEDGDLYKLLLKGGIRYKDDMAFLLLRLFYVYIWTKGESPK